MLHLFRNPVIGILDFFAFYEPHGLFPDMSFGRRGTQCKIKFWIFLCRLVSIRPSTLDDHRRLCNNGVTPSSLEIEVGIIIHSVFFYSQTVFFDFSKVSGRVSLSFSVCVVIFLVAHSHFHNLSKHVSDVITTTCRRMTG